MKRKHILVALCVLPLAASAIDLPALPDKDGADLKGYVHNGEKGVEGVLVTDGYTFTRTAADGSYYLTSSPAADFVYYTLPAGYAPGKIDNGVPEFFAPIDRSGATFQADFEITPIGDDSSFSFLVHADTQPEEYFNSEVWTEMNKAYTQMKKTSDQIALQEGFAPFNLHMGDIIYNTNTKVKDYRSYLGILATVGYDAPIYTTPGNHDRRYLADYKTALKTYTDVWGPTYHSFNRGKIHFISMDNVKIVTDGDYTKGISEAAVEWLKKDLSYIEKGSRVVFYTHQPMTRNSSALKAYSGVLDILKEYDVLILTGHLHRIFNNFPEYAPTVVERNHVALGGYEWRGPCAQDGTPNGYYIYHCDGTDISWKYVWTGKNPDTEMFRLYTNGQFGSTKYAAADEKVVTVNIWDWDEQWKHSWKLDGVDQGPLNRYDSTHDPWAAYCFDNVPGHDTWKSQSTYHVFYCNVPNTGNKVEVEVTDRFGRTTTKSITLPHVDNGGIEAISPETSGVSVTEIYNMQGMRILEVEGRPEADTLPLVAGCYVMRMYHTDGAVTVEKMMK